MRRALAVATVLLAATVAHADDPTFEALGQAPIAGGDRVRARDRALDEAFRQAVEQAVATILEPQVIAARASQLKLSVYPKARSYMTTWSIVEEGDQGALFQVRVSAQVAVARLARDVQAPQAVKPAPAQKGKAAVCLVERREAAPWTPSSLEKELARAATARGVEAAPLGGRCAPATQGATGAADDLDDRQAGALAKGTGAQGALVGLVTARETGVVRGTALATAHAEARLHLVESDGRPIGAATVERDDWDATADGALAAASREALDGALRAIGPRISDRWPSGGAAGGVVAHVAGVEHFAALQALSRTLASTPGVGGVTPRRFDPSGIDLFIETAAPAGALAAALLRAPAETDGTRFSAEAIGDLELKVRVVPPPPPPPPPPLPAAPVAPPG